jgi:hypothetical protein
MSGSSARPNPTGSPGAGPSPSAVRIVESDDWSRRPVGRGSTTRRNPSGVRLTGRIVIILVCTTGGLALFDLYLLLAGFQ